MSYVLTRRVHQLEAQLEQLRSVYDGLTPLEWRAMIDTWLSSLIRLGVAPAPDPARPTASMESLRHTHRVELEALRQTILRPSWQREHRAVGMACFLIELKRVASTR